MIDGFFIAANFLIDHLFKVVPARCPSHNAFKCTGECGFDECNTHFMEQEALQEHINRGREKKFSLMSSCSQVLTTFQEQNAIFWRNPFCLFHCNVAALIGEFVFPRCKEVMHILTDFDLKLNSLCFLPYVSVQGHFL